MSRRLSFRALMFLLGVFALVGSNGVTHVHAQELFTLSELLPPAYQDVDDIELIYDSDEHSLVLVGTPDDDEITVIVDDRRIRFWVNGEHVGRIDEDDFVPDQEAEMPEPQNEVLTIFISGSVGNDWISLEMDDSDGHPISLQDRVKFVLYGDEGDDVLMSEGVDQISFMGGFGTDVLIGDGFESKYVGCEATLPSLTSLGGGLIPDNSTDRIFPGHPESTAYRNYFLHITPVIHSNPAVRVLDKNPPKLPGVPTIASREKGDVLQPWQLTFDTILLDRDEVANEIGCTLIDLNFREDGTMLPATLVE